LDQRPYHIDAPHDTGSDRKLFCRIAEGDESAFKDIFHKFRRILYAVILSLVKVKADAKEILQESMLKLWLKRRPKRTATTISDFLSPNAPSNRLEIVR
jgi:DNA-directed RNA polymerase specialized sigma24 family protein